MLYYRSGPLINSVLRGLASTDWSQPWLSQAGRRCQAPSFCDVGLGAFAGFYMIILSSPPWAPHSRSPLRGGRRWTGRGRIGQFFTITLPMLPAPDADLHPAGGHRRVRRVFDLLFAMTNGGRSTPRGPRHLIIKQGFDNTSLGYATAPDVNPRLLSSMVSRDLPEDGRRRVRCCSATDRRSPGGVGASWPIGGSSSFAAMFYDGLVVRSAFKDQPRDLPRSFGLPRFNGSGANFAEAWTGAAGQPPISTRFNRHGLRVTISVLFATAAGPFAFSPVARISPSGRTLHPADADRPSCCPPPVVAFPLFSILRRPSTSCPTRWALILAGCGPASLSLTCSSVRLFPVDPHPTWMRAAMLRRTPTTWQIFRDNLFCRWSWPSMLTIGHHVNTINIWNELICFAADLFIGWRRTKQTLPWADSAFFGRYSTDYSMVFAALTITPCRSSRSTFLLQRPTLIGGCPRRDGLTRC